MMPAKNIYRRKADQQEEEPQNGDTYRLRAVVVVQQLYVLLGSRTRRIQNKKSIRVFALFKWSLKRWHRDGENYMWHRVKIGACKISRAFARADERRVGGRAERGRPRVNHLCVDEHKKRRQRLLFFVCLFAWFMTFASVCGWEITSGGETQCCAVGAYSDSGKCGKISDLNVKLTLLVVRRGRGAQGE